MNVNFTIDTCCADLNIINNELQNSLKKLANFEAFQNILKKLGETLIRLQQLPLESNQTLDANAKDRMVKVLLSLQTQLDYTTTLKSSISETSELISRLMIPFLRPLALNERASKTPKHDIDVQAPIALSAAFFCEIDNRDYNGVCHFEIIQCLRQGVPFISTRSLLGAIHVTKTELLLKIKIALEEELLNNKDAWTFYELKEEYGGEFLIFLPKSILKGSTEMVQLKALDLDGDKLKNININQALQGSKGPNDFEGLQHLFLIQPLHSKLFYITGHGNKESIAGLCSNNYAKFINLMQKQLCKALTISSCNSGGESALLAFSGPDKETSSYKQTKRPLFPICVRSIGDFSTLANQTSEMNFKSYFDQLTHAIHTQSPQTLGTWRKILEMAEQTKEKTWKNYAKVYLPTSFGIPAGFRPVGEHKTSISLTAFTAKKAALVPSDFKPCVQDKAEHSLTGMIAKAFKLISGKGFVELTNYEFVCLHPIQIEPALIFKDKDPCLLSMIPGDGFHIIKSIKLAASEPLEFINKIQNTNRKGGISAIKAFFIHNLEGKSQTFKEVIVLISSDIMYAAFKEEDQYFYILDSSTKRKITPFLHDMLKLKTQIMAEAKEQAVLAATAGYENNYKQNPNLFRPLTPPAIDLLCIMVDLFKDKNEVHGLKSIQDLIVKHALNPEDKLHLVSVLLREGYGKIALEIFKKEQMDVTQKDFLGDPILTLAISKNAQDFVSYLLENKTPLNVTDRHGNPAVCLAVSNNHLDILKSMLKDPSLDLNAKTTKGVSAIEFAIQLGYREAYELLSEKGAKGLIYSSADKTSPLANAVQDENLSALDFVLKEKPNPNAGSPSALIAAVRLNNLDLVKKLLLAGGDPCIKDHGGDIALVEAVLRASPALVKCLLKDYTGDLNVQNHLGVSPMIAALYVGNFEKIQTLAERYVPKDIFKFCYDSTLLNKFLNRLKALSDGDTLKKILLCFPKGFWELEKNVVIKFLEESEGHPELIADLIQAGALHLQSFEPQNNSYTLCRKIFYIISHTKPEILEQYRALIRICLQKALDSEILLKECESLLKDILKMDMDAPHNIYLKMFLEELPDFSKLPDHEDLFYKIIKEKDLDMVKLAVNKGACIHGTPYKMRPLQAAVKYKNIFKWLVEQGANVNHMGHSMRSSFFDVIRQGDMEMIEFCLQHHAELNPKGEDHCVPMQAAACIANTDQGKAFKRLVEAGGDMNYPELLNYASPFASLARTGSLEIVQWAITQGALINPPNPKANTSVLEAAITNSEDPENVIFKYLVDKSGGLSSIQAEQQAALLVQMIKHRKTDLVKWFLGMGVQVNIKPLKGKTPLQAAASVIDKEPQIFKLLMDAGANILDSGKDGKPPILHLIRRGSLEWAQALFKKGITFASYERKAIIAAVQSEKVDILKWILQQLPSQPISEWFQDAEEDQKYIWLLAILKGSSGISKLLLEKHLPPFVSNEDAANLDSILKYGRYELLEMLKDAKIQIKSPLDKKAFCSLLASVEVSKMLDFFLQNGLDPNAKIDDKCLLQFILEQSKDYSGKIQAIKILLNAGAYPRKVDGNDFIPLYDAVDTQNLEAVKLLLEKGAKKDRDLKSDLTRGFSALSLVIYRVESSWHTATDKAILELLQGD